MPLYCGACGKRRSGAFDWEPCPSCGTVPKAYRGRPIPGCPAECIGELSAAARRGVLFAWTGLSVFVAGVGWLLWRCFKNLTES